MRLALITHGLPPHEHTGVETHVARSAAALAHAGHDVCVFTRRATADLPHLAERTETRDGYRVHWLEDRVPTRDAVEAQDPPGVAAAFADFLDRERPDLVHFHHLRGLGPGCVEVARARGLPTVFTAHDFAALCHRTTMLRPDLARCTTVGDAALCARCDLATSALNRLPELGDWQAGAAADQLEPQARAELSALLEGPEPAGLAASLELRAGLEAARRETLRRVDLVLAPSRLVRERLVAWGLDPERVRPFECGVEVATLRAVPPVRGRGEGPLRFGFIGGASKHKGLAVLLEAFGQVRGPARLGVFADTTDRPHLAALRALAARADATWHGAFPSADLPAVLAQIDVLCVPSQWDENAPFVVREAFAARRPVIASRGGGSSESVRDGRDGLLVEPADRAAWTRALEELTGAPERVSALIDGIVEPADLATQTAALVELYAEVVERAARPPDPVLPHLRSFARRHRRRLEQPLGELADDVAAGLSQLAAGLGVEVPRLRLDGDTALRDGLRDERRRVEWLEHGAGEQARARAALEQEVAWLRGLLAEREAEVEWLGERARHAEAGAVEAAAASERAAEAQRRETAALGEQLEALNAELDRTRAALGAITAEHERVTAELEALHAHERWLAEQAHDLASRLGAATEPPASSDELAQSIDRARARLAELDGELRWRRREMQAALDEGGRVVRALIGRSGLGRRMSGWGRDG